MNNRVDGARVAQPLFQAAEGGSTPTSTLSLWFAEIEFERAKQLNKLWHSSLPDFGGGNCRICYAAEFEGVFYAAALWSNPSSPKLPQTTWMQLKRLAIAPDAPKNTASKMLGWMARDVRRRFPKVQVLVSYQDCDKHTGAIYAAAGWVPGPVQLRNPNTTWHNRKQAKFVAGKPNTVRRWIHLKGEPILQAKDINCEKWREYDFGGRVYQIRNPRQLLVGNSTHRIIDAEGVVHCVPAPGQNGCVVRWQASDGVNPVEF